MARVGYRSTVIKENIYLRAAELVKSPNRITSVSDFIEQAVLEKLARDEISKRANFAYLYSDMGSQSTDKRVHGDAPLSAETEGNK
ncbi:MAG: hypothetical protein JRN32_03935 [Nitrososphaerota archaeon]|nr:hypothetical protein [Nitrososphaerota archaeon]MDG7046997.1 hypothetical protein [Nitrososphaerota archaeon]